MQVNAINNVSYSQRFEGKSKEVKNKNIENNYPQMDATVSKNSDKYMRSLLYAALLAGAATGATSCVEANADADSASIVNMIWTGCHHHGCVHDTTVINNTDTIRDTIEVPVYIKDYPFHLGDSLINQGVNEDVPVDGPIPNNNGNKAIFLASKAFERYDQILYQTALDSTNTNKDQISLITKISNFEDDPENPTVSWMKSYVTDVPRKGIRIDRYVSTATKPIASDWNYSGYEIRSNGARGNTPGKNTVYVYDNSGNRVWKGEFNKGEETGSFQYSQVVIDPETGDIRYGEDGKPELAHYNFNQGKIWSTDVEYKDVPNPDFGKLN